MALVESMMTEAELMRRLTSHARRVLLRINPETGRPLFGRFLLRANGDTPSWWDERRISADWGPVVGVDDHGQAAGSIVLTARGLAVLEGEGARWLPYSDVRGIPPLSKNDDSCELTLELTSGARLTLKGLTGSPFSMARVLLYARRNSQPA